MTDQKVEDGRSADPGAVGALSEARGGAAEFFNLPIKAFLEGVIFPLVD